ncbi:MAG TPA: hypothetical protein VIG97_14450 [Luteimonas sp.]
MKRLWDVLWWALAVFFLVALIGRCTPRDDTDPPNGRSGMGLRIDHRTGCHYLTTLSLLGEAAITPRLDRTGRQICTQPEGGEAPPC